MPFVMELDDSEDVILPVETTESLQQSDSGHVQQLKDSYSIILIALEDLDRTVAASNYQIPSSELDDLLSKLSTWQETVSELQRVLQVSSAKDVPSPYNLNKRDYKLTYIDDDSFINDSLLSPFEQLSERLGKCLQERDRLSMLCQFFAQQNADLCGDLTRSLSASKQSHNLDSLLTVRNAVRTFYELLLDLVKRNKATCGNDAASPSCGIICITDSASVPIPQPTVNCADIGSLQNAVQRKDIEIAQLRSQLVLQERSRELELKLVECSAGERFYREFSQQQFRSVTGKDAATITDENNFPYFCLPSVAFETGLARHLSLSMPSKQFQPTVNSTDQSKDISCPLARPLNLKDTTEHVQTCFTSAKSSNCEAVCVQLQEYLSALCDCCRVEQTDNIKSVLCSFEAASTQQHIKQLNEENAQLINELTSFQKSVAEACSLIDAALNNQADVGKFATSMFLSKLPSSTPLIACEGLRIPLRTLNSSTGRKSLSHKFASADDEHLETENVPTKPQVLDYAQGNDNNPSSSVQVVDRLFLSLEKLLASFAECYNEPCSPLASPCKSISPDSPRIDAELTQLSVDQLRTKMKEVSQENRGQKQDIRRLQRLLRSADSKVEELQRTLQAFESRERLMKQEIVSLKKTLSPPVGEAVDQNNSTTSIAETDVEMAKEEQNQYILDENKRLIVQQRRIAAICDTKLSVMSEQLQKNEEKLAAVEEERNRIAAELAEAENKCMTLDQKLKDNRKFVEEQLAQYDEERSEWQQEIEQYKQLLKKKVNLQNEEITEATVDETDNLRNDTTGDLSLLDIDPVIREQLAPELLTLLMQLHKERRELAQMLCSSLLSNRSLRRLSMAYANDGHRGSVDSSTTVAKQPQLSASLVEDHATNTEVYSEQKTVDIESIVKQFQDKLQAQEQDAENHLTAVTTELQSQIQLLQHEKDDWTKRDSELQTEQSVLLQKLQDSNKMIEILVLDKEALKAQCNDLLLAKSALEEENDQLKFTLSSTGDSSSKLPGLEKKIEALKKALHNKEIEYCKIELDIAKLRADVTEAQTEIGNLRRSQSAALDELNRKELQITALKELVDTSHVPESVKKTMAKKDAEIERLNADVQDLRNQVAAVKDVQIAYENQQLALETTRHAIDVKESELREMKRRITDLESVLDECVHEKEILTRMNMELREQLVRSDGLDRELDGKAKQIDELKAAYENLSVHCESWKADAKAQFDHVCKEYESRINSLQNQLCKVALKNDAELCSNTNYEPPLNALVQKVLPPEYFELLATTQKECCKVLVDRLCTTILTPDTLLQITEKLSCHPVTVSIGIQVSMLSTSKADVDNCAQSHDEIIEGYLSDVYSLLEEVQHELLNADAEHEQNQCDEDFLNTMLSSVVLLLKQQLDIVSSEFLRKTELESGNSNEAANLLFTRLQRLMKTMYEQFESSVDNLRFREREFMNDQIDTLRKELKKLSERSQAVSKEAKEKELSLTAEIASLNQSLRVTTTAEKELKRLLERERQRSSDALKDADSERQKQATIRSTLEDQLRDQNEEIKRLKLELENEQQLHTDHKSLLNEAESECFDNDRKISSLQHRVQYLTKELKQTSDRSNEIHLAATNTIKELRTALEKQIAESVRQHDAHTDLLKEKQKLQGAIAVYEADVKVLRATLKAIHVENETFHKHGTDLQNRISALSAENEQLKRQVADSVSQYDQLKVKALETEKMAAQQCKFLEEKLARKRVLLFQADYRSRRLLSCKEYICSLLSGYQATEKAWLERGELVAREQPAKSARFRFRSAVLACIALHRFRSIVIKTLKKKQQLLSLSFKAVHLLTSTKAVSNGVELGEKYGRE